jgi:hypothetical protein
VLYVAAMIMTIPSTNAVRVADPESIDYWSGHRISVRHDSTFVYSNLPIITNGVRNANVLNIAAATYIGAGGLESFNFRGNSPNNTRQLPTGALPVSSLAILADLLLLWL